MSLNVRVTIAPVREQPTGPLPAGRKFGYLLHDYELHGVSRPTRNQAARHVSGLPETVKAVQPEFMPLTREWQWYWADLFSLSLFNRLYNALNDTEKAEIRLAFRSVTRGDRAFTNRHGWDNGRADYVNRVNLGSGPMAQETINCGGNVVELLSDVIRVGGKDVYQVTTLDGNQPPPDPLVVNHKTTPWLVFRATTSRRENFDPDTGRWLREDIVIPFDQLRSRDVPIPFMGPGSFNYIEADRIRVLPESSPVPDPYRR